METFTHAEDTSFTFKVDDVEPNKDFPTKFTQAKYQISRRIPYGAKMDDNSHKDDQTTRIIPHNIDEMNGLMLATYYAYINHYPLKISVSDFILMIAQGLATHMEIHAEDVRPHFVNHEGQEAITIDRFEFSGEGGNDWSTVFGQFADKVKEKVKLDFYDVMVDDTSVATKLSRIATEITIMDCFQRYFKFVLRGGCAITEVSLVGSKDDWEKLRTKVRKLKEMNKDDRLMLDWWLDRLVPVVDQIVDQAVSRKVDRDFWSKMYQSWARKDLYEPVPYINGWLNVFNPYIQNYGKNVRSTFEKVYPTQLISGVSKAPVLLQDLKTGKEHKMTVYGGFLGAKLNDDNTIGTEYFYAATFDPETKTNPSLLKPGVKKV